MLCTARDLLDLTRRRLPSKVVIKEGIQSISYGELRSRVDELATILQHLGVQKGDRVAIFLPHSIEKVVTLFAAWEIGGVAVIINDTLHRQQVHHVVSHSEAKLVVSNRQKISVIEDLPVSCQSILDVERLPSILGMPSKPLLIGGDFAMLLYTSGSTGLPKGVMLSHANLIAGAQIVADYLCLTADDTILSVLPFSFDYGLNQLLTSLLVGATLVIQRFPLPADICKTLYENNVTGLAGVPLLWQELTHPRSPFIRDRFPSLRYITNSGGRMPEALVRTLREAQPHVKIYLMYGLTEAFRSTYLPPDEVDIRPGSIGKSIPNCEILIVNNEGQLCQAGETGELLHRGPTVAMGYWRDPEETKRVFRPNPFSQFDGGYPEMVVYSGDLVRTDEDGHIYFVGRRDSMIKSHGIRISPEEIEEVAYASGFISHAVAFAVDKNEVESEIVLAIVPRDPDNFHEKALVAHCIREMPEYMRPYVIWRRETFPKTSSGKPDRMKIKQEYLQRVEVDKLPSRIRTFRR